MTKTIPDYPIKRLQSIWGNNVCCPSWPYVNHLMPTTGSGTAYFRDGADDSGNCPTWPYPQDSGAIDTSCNDLAAMKGTYSEDGRKWDVLLSCDPYIWTMFNTTGHTYMDDWLATYDNLFHANDINYVIAIDALTTGEGYEVATGVVKGVAEYKTPPTTKSFYTPPDSTYITSWEAQYGAAMDYFEAHASSNFLGYEMEFVWTNCQRWLYNRTNKWVIVKDWTGWTDATCLQATSDTDGSDVTYTVPQKFAIVDEIVVETFNNGFIPPMLGWMVAKSAYEVATGRKIYVGWNVDHPCRNTTYAMTNNTNLADSWWIWPGVGQPSNRCWWEQAGYMQLANFFKEKFGVFDSMTFNPTMPTYPWNDAPPNQWFMKLCENSAMHIPTQAKIIEVPLGSLPAAPKQNLPIAVQTTPLDVTIKVYDIYGNRANVPDADLSFTVPNTTINKTIANLGIIWAHPIWRWYDETEPCFLMRLQPSDLQQLATGAPYTLSVTYTNYSGDQTTVQVKSTFSLGTIELSKPWILPETDITGVMNDATTLYGKPGGS